MQTSKSSRYIYELLAVTVLLSLAFGVAEGADNTKPVSVHAACSDKISSSVVSVLKEQIRTSPKYRVVRTLTDEGQMDLVLTIQMSCAERANVAAIATAYGQAKCFSRTNCHLSVDPLSLRSDLCEFNTVEECGRSLYKAFDEYASNPLRPRLKLQ